MSFRQTSAVWCCFLLGDAALRELALIKGKQEGGGGGGAEGGSSSGVGNAAASSSAQTPLREVATVATALLSNGASALRSILSDCFPLFLPLLSAVAFVLRNGSLALGDKDNHSVSAHWAQAIYVSCFAFCTLFPALGRKEDVVAALIEISPVRAVAVAETEEGTGRGRAEPAAAGSRRRNDKNRKVALRPNVPRLRAFLSLFCLAWLAAAHGTIEHPFLLSDNRHYSFYAWRLAKRLLGPVGSPGRIFASALAGAAAFAWVRRRLVRSLSASSTMKKFPQTWFLGFALAAAASLVPSPLLEFRYFTTAVAVAALAGAAPSASGGPCPSSSSSSSSSAPSLGQLALALLFYLGVLAAVVRVFLMRPFEQDGELKRFMF